MGESVRESVVGGLAWAWLYPPCTMAMLFVLYVFLMWVSTVTRAFAMAYAAYVLISGQYLGPAVDWCWRTGLTKYFRGMPWFKACAEYFPIRLEKTVELPADRAYLFGYHPHGVVPAGVLSFSTEGTGWSEKYPGIRIHPAVISLLLYIPFYREWAMLHGVIPAERETMISYLKGGRSVVIPVGGAREALEAHPNTMRLVLERRKGFIRVAVESGACLVPVMSFGDNDSFNQVPNPIGSPLRSLQEKLRSILSFSIPIIYGRFNIPLLPLQNRITAVLGKPIEVVQSDDPSPEYVDQLHREYKESLINLYNDHRTAVGYGAVNLEIVA